MVGFRHLRKMLRFREVREAQITPEQRDLFERYGETVIQLTITSGHSPASSLLLKIYNNVDGAQRDAEAWLTERGDITANQEHRLEMVEWAVLIFVIIGVVVDMGLARHWFDPNGI